MSKLMPDDLICLFQPDNSFMDSFLKDHIWKKSNVTSLSYIRIINQHRNKFIHLIQVKKATIRRCGKTASKFIV